jgi:N-acetylmuramoyl-L-alanine amidase
VEIADLVLKILILFFLGACSEIAFKKRIWGLWLLSLGFWITFFRTAVLRAISIYIGAFQHSPEGLINQIQGYLMNGQGVILTDILALIGAFITFVFLVTIKIIMKTICISAGHAPNGIEAGAYYQGIREEDINAKIGKKVAEILRLHSIPTLYVPDNLDLVGTIKWINDRGNQIDIAVEVHLNAGGGKGVEGWYYAGGGESQKLSQFIIDAVSVETGMPKRGNFDETTNRYGKLGFVHDTKPLACLIECGFIDNAEDRKLYQSDEGIMKIAKGVARGILGYIGEAWKPELLNPVTHAPQPTQPTQPSQPSINWEQKYNDEVVAHKKTKEEFAKYKLEFNQTTQDRAVQSATTPLLQKIEKAKADLA